MYNSVKFNFQSDPEYTKDNWTCMCGKVHSQNHLKVCSLYDDLREEYDLEDDVELINYFDAVLKKRETEE